MTKKIVLVDARVFKLQPNRGTAKHLNFLLKVLSEEFEGKFEVYYGLKKHYTSVWGSIFYIIEEQFLIPIILLIKSYSHLVSPLHTAPLITFNTRKILIIHDLMFMDNITLYGFRGRMLFSSLYRSLCIGFSGKSGNSKIVTVSKVSQKKISDFFLINPDDISIIRNSFNFQKKFNDKDEVYTKKYMLCVTGVANHKNFDLLKRVFEGAKPPNIHLKVVGNFKKNSDSRNITYHTNLSPCKLNELYRNAVALIFPSFEEGFGIPLLEAVSVDLPVLCSDIPIFREIMGDQAIYFDPTSDVDFRAVLDRFLSVNVNRVDYGEVKRTYGTNAARKDVLRFLAEEFM